MIWQLALNSIILDERKCIACVSQILSRIVCRQRKTCLLLKCHCHEPHVIQPSLMSLYGKAKLVKLFAPRLKRSNNGILLFLLRLFVFSFEVASSLITHPARLLSLHWWMADHNRAQSQGAVEKQKQRTLFLTVPNCQARWIGVNKYLIGCLHGKWPPCGRIPANFQDGGIKISGTFGSRSHCKPSPHSLACINTFF